MKWLHRVMARTFIIGVAVLTLLLSAQSAWAAGAQITFAATADNGHGRIQVEVHDPAIAIGLRASPDPSRFRVIVGHGDARVEGVSRLAETGERVYTVLAFDRSGSFSSYWDDAFELAEKFAKSLPAAGDGHLVEVMSFHGQQYWHGQASTPDGLQAILDDVRSLGSLGSASETSLMSAIQAGALHAAEAQPEEGARQLVVFTDAGEEGRVFEVDETIAYVRGQGVPVYPVILKDNVKAQYFDEIKRLAEESGGRHLHGESVSVYKVDMRAFATAAKRLFWLDLGFCGVSTPTSAVRFEDTIEAEVLGTAGVVARTSKAPLRQHASGAATGPCSAPPGEPAVSTPARTTQADTDSRVWPWFAGGTIVLGLLALLLLLLLWLLLRLRGRDPDSTAPPKSPGPSSSGAEAPVAPALSATEEVTAVEDDASTPPVQSPGLAAGWVNPLKQAPLPDTRLYVERGPTTLPQYLFLNKKEYTIGASAGQVDQVIDLPQLSGKHATFLLYPMGDVYVTDHSTNGVFIDDQRIEQGTRVKLSRGQRIRLASQVELRLEQPGQGSTDGATSATPAPGPSPTPAAGESPSSGPRPKSRTIYQPVGDDGAGTDARGPLGPRSAARGRPKSKTVFQPLTKDEDKE